jgi:hypothetical protein
MLKKVHFPMKLSPVTTRHFSTTLSLENRQTSYQALPDFEKQRLWDDYYSQQQQENQNQQQSSPRKILWGRALTGTLIGVLVAPFIMKALGLGSRRSANMPDLDLAQVQQLERPKISRREYMREMVNLKRKLPIPAPLLALPEEEKAKLTTKLTEGISNGDLVERIMESRVQQTEPRPLTDLIKRFRDDRLFELMVVYDSRFLLSQHLLEADLAQRNAEVPKH